MTPSRPCVHHWEIAPAEPCQGGLSPGCCRYCGESREFHNSTDDPNWKKVKHKTFKELIAIRKAAAELEQVPWVG
mgnify:FL=1